MYVWVWHRQFACMQPILLAIPPVNLLELWCTCTVQNMLLWMPTSHLFFVKVKRVLKKRKEKKTDEKNGYLTHTHTNTHKSCKYTHFFTQFLSHTHTDSFIHGAYHKLAVFKGQKDCTLFQCICCLPVCCHIPQLDWQDSQGSNTAVHPHHAGWCSSGAHIYFHLAQFELLYILSNLWPRYLVGQNGWNNGIKTINIKQCWSLVLWKKDWNTQKEKTIQNRCKLSGWSPSSGNRQLIYEQMMKKVLWIRL